MPKENPSDRPWLCAEAIEELERILGPESEVFEWGAGNSTIWLARRAKRVVSIEHEPWWHEYIRDRLIDAGLANRVELRLSSAERSGYPLQIAAFSSFDLVIVDGEFRARCMERSRYHVKPGGFLVLDDSERRRYRKGIVLLADWDCKVVTGRKSGSLEGQTVSTQTSFFRRPMK